MTFSPIKRKGYIGPCDHPGCASHVSHPCEKCGRQWGPREEAPEPTIGGALEQFAEGAVEMAGHILKEYGITNPGAIKEAKALVAAQQDSEQQRDSDLWELQDLVEKI